MKNGGFWAICLIVLAVCLYTITKVPEKPVKIVQIDRQVTLLHDTLRQIRLKYVALHDTQTIINEKFDTIYLALTGDTSCSATRRLIAMHRQLDSCGK
jgi:hypothetical protein